MVGRTPANDAFEKIGFDRGESYTSAQTNYPLISDCPVPSRKFNLIVCAVSASCLTSLAFSRTHRSLNDAQPIGATASSTDDPPDCGQLSIGADGDGVRCGKKVQLASVCASKEKRGSLFSAHLITGKSRSTSSCSASRQTVTVNIANGAEIEPLALPTFEEIRSDGKGVPDQFEPVPRCANHGLPLLYRPILKILPMHQATLSSGPSPVPPPLNTSSDLWVRAARIFFFVVATGLFLSTLYYILRTANPVMRSDAWYFFDVFVRKALNGSVTVGDLFVKRFGADHAQPLFKLLLLAELHFYDLDDSLQAIIGLLAAGGCALILCKSILAGRSGGRSDALRYLAASAACALMFSMQSPGVWTWPLVALGYVTIIPILLFFWSLWTAWQSHRFAWLVVATMVLGIIDDDSALIVVLAAILTIIFISLIEPVRRGVSTWKVLAIIFGITVIVRIAYSFSVKSGGSPLSPLTSYLNLLMTHSASDALRWITIPLTSSLMTPAAPFGITKRLWDALQSAVLAALFIAQLIFWWSAFRGKYTRVRFFAVCLMLLSYAWLAGILLYRVSQYGTNYLFQERYVQLFGFNVVALLLMAISSRHPLDRAASGVRKTAGIALAAGCLFIVGLQGFYIADAWHHRPYLIHYYQGMGNRLEQLAKKPEDNNNCYPELVVCQIPLAERTELLELLVQHQLNVFSPAVRHRHPYLEHGVAPK